MDQFKFCPKCGSTEITITNAHRLECHNCHLTYYHNIAAAVGVIIEKNNHLLFTVREVNPKRGYLDLPGGFTDPDETAEETCHRELKEELNLKIPPHQFSYFMSAPNYYEYGGVTYRTEDLIFTAVFPDHTELIREKEEIAAIRWIEKSQIDLENIGFPSLRSAVSKYLEADRLSKKLVL